VQVEMSQRKASRVAYKDRSMVGGCAGAGGLPGEADRDEAKCAGDRTAPPRVRNACAEELALQ